MVISSCDPNMYQLILKSAEIMLVLFLFRDEHLNEKASEINTRAGLDFILRESIGLLEVGSLSIGQSV